MQEIKPFQIVAGFFMLLVVGYIGFRYWQVEKVPSTVDISQASSIKSLPPTVCSIRNTQGTIKGTLYLFHDAARFDIPVPSTAADGVTKSVELHVIVVHDEDTAYVWRDGDAKGYSRTYEDAYKAIGLDALSTIHCSPWWIPVGTIFIIPQDVAFPSM